MSEKSKQIPKYVFDGWGVLVLFMGAIIPSILFEGLLQVCSVIMGNKSMNSVDFPIFSTLIMWLGAILFFDYFICRKQTKLPLRFRFTPSTPLLTCLAVVMTMGAMLVSEYFVSLIPTKGKFWGDWYQKYEQMMMILGAKPWSMMILSIIIAPLFEEIVFRGIVQRGLLNKGVSAWKSIVLSALFFGMIHGNPWQFVGAFIIGLSLGFLYHKSGTLMLPILLHSLNNGIALTLYYMGNEGVSDFFQIPTFLVLVMGICILAISIFIMNLFKFSRY